MTRYTVPVLAVAALTSACGALRLHDAGRHAAAQQAAELAAEVAETELGFDAMLSNVDSIGAVRGEFLDRHRRNELEAFLDDLTDLTRDDAAGVIDEAVQKHVEARREINGDIESAVAAVNAALDRRKTIKAVLGERKPSSLEETIDRIDARLEWLDGRIADYRETLEGIRDDDAVADARKLFAQLKREVTQLETERLLAFRGQLRRLEALRDSFDRRAEVFDDKLVLPARGALDAWAACAPLAVDATLAAFVAADGCGPGAPGRRPAVDLVERLMLLRFSEMPHDEKLLIELGRMRYREALRVSSINARQRLGLVQQVADALQIYYSGGIHAEDMASLVLATAQVGALVFIGDNVD